MRVPEALGGDAEGAAARRNGDSRAPPMIGVRCAKPAGRRHAVLLAGGALWSLACGSGAPPPRIAYPYPWLGPALTRAAQPAIDAWGSPRVAEIPESLMAGVTVRPGYAGDVDYAVATVAMPGLVAAVGPQSSRSTLLTMPIYAEREIPFIAATATSSKVRAGGPWVFQLAPDADAEGAFIARFILDHLNLRRVTVFYLDASEYGNGLRNGIVQALAARGVVPLDQVGIIETSPFPRRVAASLRRWPPDVVVVAARPPEAIAIVRSVHALLSRVRVVVADAVPLDKRFIAAAGQAAAIVYGVTWWAPDLPDSVSRAFVARWQRVNGSPPSVSDAMYYDAIMLAAQAVREVGPRRAAMRNYLRELGAARPAYRGVTGAISFQRDRETNLHVTRVANGAEVLVDWR
jgi:ABC-type branched-subunit amino acid transport system substrate-binding protein